MKMPFVESKMTLENIEDTATKIGRINGCFHFFLSATQLYDYSQELFDYTLCCNSVKEQLMMLKMYIQGRFRRYNDIFTSNKICIRYNMKVLDYKICIRYNMKVLNFHIITNTNLI